MRSIFKSLIFCLIPISSVFSMKDLISDEKVVSQAKPLPTVPPKGMFWTQGEQGGSLLKVTPPILLTVEISDPHVKKSTHSSYEDISTLDSSDEEIQKLALKLDQKKSVLEKTHLLKDSALIIEIKTRIETYQELQVSKEEIFLKLSGKYNEELIKKFL